MEERERNYITKYLPQLIHRTICNDALLAKLRAENILSPLECQILEVRGKNAGSISQAYHLYELLFMKTNSYDILLASLSDPAINQSGAVQILANGKSCNFNLTLLENIKDDAIVQARGKYLYPLRQLTDLVQNKKMPIVVISSEDINLTTERIQAEQIPHYYHVFSSKETLLQKYASAPSGSAFVIAMYGRKEEALKGVLRDVHEVTTSAKQCIVVTTESQEIVSDALEKVYQSSQYGIIKDKITWNQLSGNFKTKLLSQMVKFQGDLLALDELLTLFNIAENRDRILEGLESKVLIQLINDENPIFCKNTLENSPTPPFYIHRKILSRSVAISDEILKQSQSDTSFAITGMTRTQLVNVNGDSFSTSEQQVRSMSKKSQGLTGKIILLNRPELEQQHFGVLCNRVKSDSTTIKNLHWLHRSKRGQLEWIRSHGSLSLVQDHIMTVTDDMRNSCSETEQNFIIAIIQETSHDFKKRPAICISDTPGMGKSMLLAHIGEQLLQTQKVGTGSPRFVQYFGMTELMRDLEEAGIHKEKYLTKAKVTEILLRKMMGTIMMSQLFLRKGSKCELMLDGLDEVLPHQIKLAFKFISILRHEFNSSTDPSIRIWLTTRPVLLKSVEDTLGVLGYNMLPFDESDQKMFLKQYWIQEARKRGVELNPEKLDFFCEGSLKTMRRVNRGLSKFEMEMTGIPLQCLLHAQVCEGSVNYECSVENDGALNLEEEGLDRLAIKNVADLYNRVMDKKLEIFLNRESSSTTHLESHISKNNKQVMKRIHMKLALELLFPEWLHEFEIIFLHETNISPEELSIYGFVVDYSQQNQPIFVHRTYAEYFVALFVVEVGTCERLLEGFRVTGQMGKFFLNGILATTPEMDEMKNTFANLQLAALQMPMVTYFIDELLEMRMEEGPIPRNLLTSIQTNFEEISDKPFETSSSKILACITEDRPYLLKLLVECLDENGKQNWLQKSVESHTKMMFAAAIRGTTTGLQMLCSLLEGWQNQEISELPYQFAKNPILAAALMGNVESVEYLVLKKGFRPEVWAHPEQKILHKVVEHSISHKQGIIENRANIINFLVENQGRVEPENSILEHLDSFDRTPLLAEEVHIKLRMTLIEAGANIQACNVDGNQVLHMLGDFTGITPVLYHELIQLIEAKVLETVNDPDERGWIFSNTSGIGIMGHLYTPNWFWHNDTALHLAVGHIEVTDETLDLFNKYGFNWNTGNSDEYTLLHVAVKFGRSMRLIKKLIELGANWTIPNAEGRSTFMEAAWTAHLEFLKWICENFPDFDIDMEDNNRRTALHYAMKAPKEHKFQAVRILMENGADPNCLSFDGDTPLVHSLYEGYGISVELLQYLRANGANILGNVEEDKAEVLNALFSMATTKLDNEYDLIAVMEYLINEGAVCKKVAGKPNLVHKAAENGWMNGFKHLEKAITRDEFITMATARDSMESTPIYYAIDNENTKSLEVLKWLIDTVGGNIEREACGKGGVRPLHVCAKAGWIEGMELLLDRYRVDIQETDNDGNIALHMAYSTKGMHTQVVKYLEMKMIRMGIENYLVRNFRGETPAEYGDRDAEEARGHFEGLW